MSENRVLVRLINRRGTLAGWVVLEAGEDFHWHEWRKLRRVKRVEITRVSMDAFCIQCGASSQLMWMAQEHWRCADLMGCAKRQPAARSR